MSDIVTEEELAELIPVSQETVSRQENSPLDARELIDGVDGEFFWIQRVNILQKEVLELRNRIDLIDQQLKNEGVHSVSVQLVPSNDPVLNQLAPETQMSRTERIKSQRSWWFR